MNQRIAQAAIDAMNDPNIEAKPGMCSRFVRQVVMKVYGEKVRGLFGGSAIDTGRRFQKAGLDVNVDANHLEVGDILVKMRGSGGFGHIGIFVGPKGVAENSSTSIGRVSGAKGFRTLGQWGQFDVVARIPESGSLKPTAQDKDEEDAAPQEPLMYHLMLNGVKIADMPVHEGKALCSARAWANALNFDLDWNEDTRHVMFNGREVDAPVTLIMDRAYLPIRDLVAAAGLKILSNDPKQHIITVGK